MEVGAPLPRQRSCEGECKRGRAGRGERAAGLAAKHDPCLILNTPPQTHPCTQSAALVHEAAVAWLVLQQAVRLAMALHALVLAVLKAA